MSRCFRAGTLACALTLLCAACVPPVVRIPFDDVHRNAINSSKTIAIVSQDELQATIDPSQGGGVILGGLLGAILDSAIDAGRTKTAVAQVGPLQDALVFHDARSTVQAVLGAELQKAGVLEGTELEPTRTTKLDRVAVRGLVDSAGTDVVLVMNFDYLLSPDFRHLVVAGGATILPTRTASSPALKQLADSPSVDGSLPCPALYRGVFMTSMPAPQGRWTADQGAAAVTAIDGGIAEIARMFLWDLDQGAPQDGKYAASGAAIAYTQFGMPRVWATAREENGRQWLRSRAGELASVGETYPAAGPAEGGAKAVRIARVFGAVQAVSYTPSSAQHAAGGIGAVEIVNPAARAIEAAKEKAEAMHRAFGSTESAPVDPAAGIFVDRLTRGRTTFSPDLAVYVRTALTAELGRIGFAVEAGRPTLRGEILGTDVLRSHQGIGATLRVRYELVDGAGKVLYTGTKDASTAAEELADSEVDAFHTVLRKSAEALALDPAFAAAVQ